MRCGVARGELDEETRVRDEDDRVVRRVLDLRGRGHACYGCTHYGYAYYGYAYYGYACYGYTHYGYTYSGYTYLRRVLDLREDLVHACLVLSIRLR